VNKNLRHTYVQLGLCERKGSATSRQSINATATNLRLCLCYSKQTASLYTAVYQHSSLNVPSRSLYSSDSRLQTLASRLMLWTILASATPIGYGDTLQWPVWARRWATRPGRQCSRLSRAVRRWNKLHRGAATWYCCCCCCKVETNLKP